MSAYGPLCTSRVTKASLITGWPSSGIAQRLELLLRARGTARRAPALARRCRGASRPLRLMNSPVRPSVKALVRDQSTFANQSRDVVVPSFRNR